MEMEGTAGGATEIDGTGIAMAVGTAAVGTTAAIVAGGIATEDGQPG